ncbi:MAG: hypothetical protein DKM50_05245 [Candidatus Margulisiibacteriota bacterium]|nr:MAG: hypothetical protein A2X43_08640 [Candidatus Margulisbacteria bacterium GWD2_39_127]OGI02306.1 MAG: hypothetical protein A2X42_07030 [Candidatus Margulisbacteria bacterium GWF2_38_17]OGI11356.1 MAG: hypothetical protein A2X41_07950 [Candidatus Margulisbacteria bacterium GWE2_39_32]PZM81873.1 MAG: hypothetical protein DKM50_05245 [Candidatus Margulisiibacteriota bacterium]HAR63090.1 hypothetical protein [Candidatus Margulisiibacteriota bacterium]
MRFLLVEDNPGDARLVREHLSEVANLSIELENVMSLSEAIERLHVKQFDIILLDLSLPDSQGLDTFYGINSQAPNTAIIILTGFNDEQFAVKAVHEGAQDYLVKGWANSDVLLRSIKYAAERKKSEEERLQREKLQGVLEMAGAACHELNQPMQAILGYVALLLAELPKDSQLYTIVNKIQEEVERLAVITGKLSTISKYVAYDYSKGVKVIDIDKSSEGF